jgi:hypothetical protein
VWKELFHYVYDKSVDEVAATFLAQEEETKDSPE